MDVTLEDDDGLEHTFDIPDDAKVSASASNGVLVAGSVSPEYMRLYELANAFMAELGAEGEITINMQSRFAEDWMNALWDIDKGTPLTTGN